MNIVILAGGHGSKIWPFNRYHNKAMIPISNKPILAHLVDSIQKESKANIYITANEHIQEIRHYFRKHQNVEVIAMDNVLGSGDALYHLKDYLKEEFLVFFGDCLFHQEDVQSFINSNRDVLLSTLHQKARDCVCVEITDTKIQRFWGHPRGDGWQYYAAAFRFSPTIFDYLNNIEVGFNTTKVGVGSPSEMFLENALNDSIDDGEEITYLISKHQIYDIDKPWQILEANEVSNRRLTSALVETSVGNNSHISNSAKINGFVHLGDNSYIGDQVKITGNVIVGDNTIIDNGAILSNGAIVGDNCSLQNYCKVGSYSSIGNQCVIDHTAELLGGVLFSKVYLYHYGEYFGVIGKNTDLGAGTTCGTLRFDDGETRHQVNSRKEIPLAYSNASFIGDYSRTGVGVMIMPGCKVGCKSVIGSGIVLQEDIEDNTIVSVKQEIIKKPWGDHKYGW